MQVYTRKRSKTKKRVINCAHGCGVQWKLYQQTDDSRKLYKSNLCLEMDQGLTFQIEKGVCTKVRRNKPVYNQRAIGNCHGWRLKLQRSTQVDEHQNTEDHKAMSGSHYWLPTHQPFTSDRFPVYPAGGLSNGGTKPVWEIPFPLPDIDLWFCIWHSFGQ